MVKDKIDLTGLQETMLIPLYARAWASRQKNPDFVDEVAIKVVDNGEYDFSKWKKNRMNIWGCAGRTSVLDREVKKYISAHPDASIINLACGLDDRFSRVDNGTIHWYNIDFGDIMSLRCNIIDANDRVVDLAMDMLDFSWMDKVINRENVLVIAEGILMYINEKDVKELFDKIATSFDNVTLLIELMTKWMVDNQKLHDVSRKGNTFVYGVNNSSDIATLCPAYKYIADFNVTDAMKRYSKVFIGMISKILSPKNNRIALYEKINK